MELIVYRTIMVQTTGLVAADTVARREKGRQAANDGAFVAIGEGQVESVLSPWHIL